MVVKTFDDGSEMELKHVAAIAAIGLAAGAITVGAIEVKERIKDRLRERKIMKFQMEDA